MRLRNVKGAKEIICNSRYIINDYCNYKGSFNSLFGNSNPIHIEVGMGKGDFIIGMALSNPNINFIGIEKFDSVLVRAVQKLDSLDIPNLRLIRMDALCIDEVFSKEIDCLYLNFSDPWPKERHSKRRLTSDLFLSKYDSIFSDVCNIVMKTDNRKLFEYSIMSFNNYGYLIDSLSLDLYNDDLTGNVQTEYEKKFVSNGAIIYKIVVHK
jgi:tRNA (guanine-N7-)-methyltransferase